MVLAQWNSLSFRQRMTLDVYLSVRLEEELRQGKIRNALD